MRWWEPDRAQAEQDVAEVFRDERLESEPEQRSMMAELLGPDLADDLEVAPGRFYLPGPPP
jgi:hypothetical protein